MIPIVPIQHIETSVRANFQGHGHEPDIVAIQKIGFALREVSRAIALQAVHIDRAAVNISDHYSLAELRWIRVRIEKCYAAIRSLPMTMVRDRAKRNGERRECARLP